MSAPAGWHQQSDGRERYWDGGQWTDQYRDPAGVQPAKSPSQKKRSLKHLIGYPATALLALLLGVGMGASGKSSGTSDAGASTPSATAPAATVTQTVTPTAAPPTTVFKTVTVKVTPRPATAITEGVWQVGTDIAPGTYKVIDPIASGGCYWEINPTGSSDIVDNGTPTGGRPVVILRKGQSFTNQGCGDWAKIG